MPDLIRSGYEVLIQAGGDADCFVKKEQSLFLFFQSHPEYQLDTLLLEYRRDVARFLLSEENPQRIPMFRRATLTSKPCSGWRRSR